METKNQFIHDSIIGKKVLELNGTCDLCQFDRREDCQKLHLSGQDTICIA